VLSKNFVVPNAPPSLQEADSRYLDWGDLIQLLNHSLWTPELEHALENFSLGAFLDHTLATHHSAAIRYDPHHIVLGFFNYLEANVSPPRRRREYLSASAYHINQNKSKLHLTHATRYLEYVMLTINIHPSAEKYYLLITVWVVFQESDRRPGYRYYLVHDEFERFFITLSGFNSTDITWDSMHYRLMRDPHNIHNLPSILGPICGTQRLILEPILSHHLVRVAISCMQYLSHGRLNTQDHLLAWAIKSKQSPWLWRQRIRVTSTRRHGLNTIFEHPYSFPQSLRRLRQILYSEKVQSEKFCWEQHKFYRWTLNILYLTLRKAKKSDELTRAISKLSIPLSASILFPRQIKRVRKAIDAYLDKVSRRACSDSTRRLSDPLMYLYHVDSSVHHPRKHLEGPRVEGFRLIR
jgi:hypothetical protein